MTTQFITFYESPQAWCIRLVPHKLFEGTGRINRSFEEYDFSIEPYRNIAVPSIYTYADTEGFGYRWLDPTETTEVDTTLVGKREAIVLPSDQPFWSWMEAAQHLRAHNGETLEYVELQPRGQVRTSFLLDRFAYTLDIVRQEDRLRISPTRSSIRNPLMTRSNLMAWAHHTNDLELIVSQPMQPEPVTFRALGYDQDNIVITVSSFSTSRGRNCLDFIMGTRPDGNYFRSDALLRRQIYKKIETQSRSKPRAWWTKRMQQHILVLAEQPTGSDRRVRFATWLKVRHRVWVLNRLSMGLGTRTYREYGDGMEQMDLVRLAGHDG